MSGVVDDSLFALVVVITLFAALLGIGVHQAINKLLKLADGHLERLQGKLDVLLAAQVEHNEKMDILLRKML